MWFLLVEYPHCTCCSKLSKRNLQFRPFLLESQVPLQSATLSICLMQVHTTAHSSFNTAIICVRSSIWKYHFCSLSCCFCMTPPATPSTSLLIVCTVSAALCCRQGVNPVASVGTPAGQWEQTDTCTPEIPSLFWFFCPGWVSVELRLLGLHHHWDDQYWIWNFPLQWSTTKNFSCELVPGPYPPDMNFLQAGICIQNSSHSLMEPYKLQSLVCG